MEKIPTGKTAVEQVLRLVDLVGNDERGIYAALTAFPHMGGAIFLEAWTTLKERRDEAWREDQKLWREDQEINWISQSGRIFPHRNKSLQGRIVNSNDAFRCAIISYLYLKRSNDDYDLLTKLFDGRNCCYLPEPRIEVDGEQRPISDVCKDAGALGVLYREKSKI